MVFYGHNKLQFICVFSKLYFLILQKKFVFLLFLIKLPKKLKFLFRNSKNWIFAYIFISFSCTQKTINFLVKINKNLFKNKQTIIMVLESVHERVIMRIKPCLIWKYTWVNLAPDPSFIWRWALSNNSIEMDNGKIKHTCAQIINTFILELCFVRKSDQKTGLFGVFVCWFCYRSIILISYKLKDGSIFSSSSGGGHVYGVVSFEKLMSHVADIYIWYFIPEQWTHLIFIIYFVCVRLYFVFHKSTNWIHKSILNANHTFQNNSVLWIYSWYKFW